VGVYRQRVRVKEEKVEGKNQLPISLKERESMQKTEN